MGWCLFLKSVSLDCVCLEPNQRNERIIHSFIHSFIFVYFQLSKRNQTLAYAFLSKILIFDQHPELSVSELLRTWVRESESVYGPRTTDTQTDSGKRTHTDQHARRCEIDAVARHSVIFGSNPGRTWYKRVEMSCLNREIKQMTSI